MAIKMVREPSETPNINNIDDFIPFRYAYGNQDGYVIGKGTEFDKEIIGNTFRIKSGRAVIQGVEIEIDANGYDVIIDPIQEKRYYLIYFEVDLSTMSVSIKTMYDNNGYPADLGQNDDLTENSSGIAKLLIYAIETYNGVIEAVHKQIKRIKYTKGIVVDNSTNAYNINNLNIMRNEDNVVVLEDVIIPQIKLLWSGNWREDNSSLSFVGLKVGDEIEIEYDIVSSSGSFQGATKTAKFVLNNYSNSLYIQSLGYALETTGNAIASPQIISSFLSVNVPISTDSQTTISRESQTYKTYMYSENAAGTNPVLNVSYNYFLVINKIYKIIK